MADDAIGNGAGLSLTALFGQPMTLWRKFPQAPDVRVGFSFRLYLSEAHANRREALIGATPEEKAGLLRGYKIAIICDALADVPQVLRTVGDREQSEPLTDFPPPGYKEDATEEEKRADLQSRSAAYFNKRDSQGNLMLWFLVESLFTEYWERALPDLFRPPDKNSNPAIILPSK